MEEKKDKDCNQEKIEKEKEKEDAENEALNALDDFDNKLNLTADEKDNLSEKGDEGMDDLNKELENLMKQFQMGLGDPGIPQNNPMFDGMFNNMKLDGNMEDLADNLLGEFLNKEILYEPLKEAKQAYEEFFISNNNTLTTQESTNYHAQHEVLKEILETLDNEPQNKEKLTNLFEKMQDNGTPPPFLGASGFPMPFPNVNSNANMGGDMNNCNMQ